MRHHNPTTEGGMFKLPHRIAWSEAELNSLPDPGQEREYAERREAFRKSRGPEFIERYTGDGDIESTCPICQSTQVESDSFDSYGGTTEGYTSCVSCGYSTSWADLSAVI